MEFEQGLISSENNISMLVFLDVTIRPRGKKKDDAPTATSAQQLVGGHDLTCASHPVMDL